MNSDGAVAEVLCSTSTSLLLRLVDGMLMLPATIFGVEDDADNVAEDNDIASVLHEAFDTDGNIPMVSEDTNLVDDAGNF